MTHLIDDFDVFEESVRRGLWIAEPEHKQKVFTISDIEGRVFARHKQKHMAIRLALSKIEASIRNPKQKQV